MNDVHSRTVPQLHSLAGEREGARDERLRRHDRGGGGQHDHGIETPLGHEGVEWVPGRRGIVQKVRSLAQIVEHEGRQHQSKPRQTDRLAAEMPHVGIQRLATRHDQDDRAEHHQTGAPFAHEEIGRVPRIERVEHVRLPHDAVNAQSRDRDEPETGDRSEERAHARCTAPLQGEESEDDDEGDRYDQVLERRRGDAESFDGAEHGDGRRDDAVAVEQCRPEDADRREQRPRRGRALARAYQRQQREDPALAPVVGAHDHREVFEGDDEIQRPEDERKDPENVLATHGKAVRSRETLLECVERAGADVAVHDADGAEGERCEHPAGRWSSGRNSHARRPAGPTCGEARAARRRTSRG